MAYLRDRQAYADAAAGPAWVRRLGETGWIGPTATRMWRAYYQRQVARRWDKANHASRQAFREHPPVLDAVQRRVADDLIAHGLAIAPVTAFLPPELWQTLQAEAEAWLRSPDVLDAEAAFYRGTARKSKPWRVAMFGQGAEVPRESPWLQAGIQPRILDTVNSYLGLFSRLQYLDLWETLRMPEAEPDHPAQGWHRDSEDRQLVRIFLYFTDVDDANGALRYVPSSRPGEKWGSLWPQQFPAGAVVPPHELERVIPASTMRSCAGPAGTLVFIDTAGFHRGGRARDRHRVVGTWTYVTPASISPRSFVIRHAVPAETHALPQSVQCALDSGPDGDWIDTVLLPAVAAKAARRAEGLRVKQAIQMERARQEQEKQAARMERARQEQEKQAARMERARQEQEKQAARMERARQKQEKQAARMERARQEQEKQAALHGQDYALDAPDIAGRPSDFESSTAAAAKAAVTSAGNAG